MEVAKQLYLENLTPGQLVFKRLSDNIKSIPEFYRSDLQNELDSIWNFQKKFHPEILTDELYDSIKGKTKTITSAIFKKLNVEGLELKGTQIEKRFQKYQLRSQAVNKECSINELSEVFADINNNINSSSGYLGNISDRSKELFFNKQTIGQYLYERIKSDPHYRLKNIVFYRQDYLDEFNTIWEEQSKHYPNLLTEDLKSEIRDVIIFYQRRLKSQKGLLSICELEGQKREIEVDGKKKIKIVGPKVCPKSSPIFQDFRILAQINNIEVTRENQRNGEKLAEEEKALIFKELTWKASLSSSAIISLLKIPKGFKLNFEKIEGNRTKAAFLEACEKMFDKLGYEEFKFSNLKASEIEPKLHEEFKSLGINEDLIHFTIDGTSEDQLFYQFWHLIYSFEGDNSVSGIDNLKAILSKKFGFPSECASIMAAMTLQDDYSSLSAKAIKNIMPFLKEGNRYDEAAVLAGYNHSNSETKEDLDKKILIDQLQILSKNSLRNPVVEKILNQMINVVNEVIVTYGKPDEIRLEMARDLKKSAKEREDTTKNIRKATDEHEKYRTILQKEFGLPHVSRNDLVRYKLYLELEKNGYKTLYSNQYIPKEKIFSHEIDIEHIIPQSRLFDDSFSNKTLEYRSVNLKKGNDTALDFILKEYGEPAIEEYKMRVQHVFPFVQGSKTKHAKLLMSGDKIPDNFIERELRDTQYIAKKAREILLTCVRTVSTTTGSITEKLRSDWQLIDVLEELNLPKYDVLGLVETKTNRHGESFKRIKDWTKRNDHRHHAMDAITVAFTKPSIVQYLNNMNAKSEKNDVILAIQKKETYFDKDQKRRFNPPIPLAQFRVLAKGHLENILVSFKAKNKVSTKNKNIIKTSTGKKTIESQTPRGQLHLETVYGSSKEYATKMEKVNASFDQEKIQTVANSKHRRLLLERLNQNNNDPQKAFTGANSLSKKPIYLNDLETFTLPETVKTVTFENRYTIRKAITPDLKIDKVIDPKIREILQARLEKYGDPKKAFSNLEEDPIYQNKEKGIVIKSVKIYGVSNAISLHTKKDHFGNPILDNNGNEIPVDFVNTGNNHHVAIYEDEKGDYKEEVVSLFEAITRKNQGIPVIKKIHENGWKLVFTLKQNEYFVFPNDKTGFVPSEIDLMDILNFSRISPNLFRVQKIATSNYFFRHHFETMLTDASATRGILWENIRSTNNMKGKVKVRLNHLGHITQVGEY